MDTVDKRPTGDCKRPTGECRDNTMKTPAANERLTMKNSEQYGDYSLIPDKPKKEFN